MAEIGKPMRRIRIEPERAPKQPPHPRREPKAPNPSKEKSRPR